MLSKTHVLALIALLLAGCDQKEFLKRTVPKADDAFARSFIETVRTGDYGAASGMLDASIRGEKSAKGIRDLSGVLAHGEPLSIDVIGCYIFAKASAHEGVTRTTNLTYQIHFPDSWVAGNVMVAHPAGAMSVLGTHFQPIPDSLETLNRVTLLGKSGVHYLFLAACLVVPALILIALIVCMRSQIRRKWLWIIFILIGFGQFRLDWTTGHVGVQTIYISLLGVSVFRASPYAPWIISVAIPIGAMIFLARRRKLLLNNPPKLPDLT